MQLCTSCKRIAGFSLADTGLCGIRHLHGEVYDQDSIAYHRSKGISQNDIERHLPRIRAHVHLDSSGFDARVRLLHASGPIDFVAVDQRIALWQAKQLKAG